MAKYSVVVSQSAEKVLKKLPKKDLLKLLATIESLAVNPYPDGCRKLSGEEETYRVRQGNYRVIYEVEGKRLLVLVLKVGHRKDIYR